MDKVSFVEFFLLWAKRQQWEVPDIHVIACHWLEHKGNLAVLRCFRGFGKSTILAVYNAWKLYKDPTFRILHQSETDGTAYKTSRDTKNVLRKHPLTKDLLQQGKASGSVIGWWVNGATDIRNASMYSRGILSNVTSARADECQNDDVEVPRNTTTEEAREKMRERLDEQTHILVPNGSKLYIGTPHTYDSLYDRIEKMGADCLTIKMFEEEHRITLADKTNYEIPFEPEYVMSNIGGAAKVLIKDIDYQQHKNMIFFNEPPNGLIDCYAGPAWPERFTIEELEKRRRETETINKWDSQYQLHAKPITETRLDPNRLIKYTHDMTVKEVNKTIVCFVGGTRIVGASAYWDCSLGKDKSDGSVLTLVLTDATGCLYIHHTGELKGDLAVFDDDENKGNIIGGQVYGVREAVLRFNIPSVIIETNGVGGFVPPILRKALKGTGCAVIEKTAKGNKQERILSALEAPLSSGFLYAHANVFNTKLIEQMRTFNPLATNQKDDFLDSLTGAVLQTPIRIGKIYNRDINKEASVKPWRANTKIHRVSIDF